MPRKILRSPSSPVIQFIEYHQPALDSGRYHVRVEQVLDAVAGKIPGPQAWTRELAFAVVGERFSTLAPHELSAVFPARDSLGDHQNVLPHITLRRSTLPWERAPNDEDDLLPWLALLVVRDSDFATEADGPRVQVMSLGQLRTDESAKFPRPFDYEPGQSADDDVTVVDIPKPLLASILPTKRALGYPRAAAQGRRRRSARRAARHRDQQSAPHGRRRQHRLSGLGRGPLWHRRPG